MKKYFLITTALENTWPEDGSEPTLFLGEWCRLYSRKERWEMMNVEVLPYHWDDRKKLFNDYQYLRALNERILESLANSLNQYHRVNYSLRYWRIVVGPWLMMVLPTLFDRWESIKLAVESYSINETYVTDKTCEDFVPLSMEHFSSLIKTDEWNHMVYAQIFDFIKFDKASKKPLKNYSPVEPSSSQTKVNLNQTFRNIIGLITALFSQNNDYFFISTYLKRKDVVKLQIKLHQFPGLYQDQSFVNNTSVKIDERSIIESFSPINEFEAFVKSILPLQIPLIYLEGYSELIRQTKSNFWPKKPKLIWTSNSYFMNDIFKAWAASKVNAGASLVIGQHGGHYGQGLFSFTEYHELTASDFYLSWGWERNEKKIIPLGRIRKSLETSRNKLTKKSFLLLLSGTSRYSGGIASMPIAGQWLEYLKDQIEFYDNLPAYISDNSVVRLYPHDYDWGQQERWLDCFPNSTVDYCEKTLEERLKTTKLFVGGWNTTTYLEALASNIPTVIFWDDKYFEVREEVVAMFEDLKKAGIFHPTPISAANHVKSIWNNIDNWWLREDVVKARNSFVDRFVNSTKTVEDLCETFKKISNKRNCIIE